MLPQFATHYYTSFMTGKRGDVMSGILYGVSVGPGDPELITLKAVRIIKECEVIAVPRTRGENTLALEIVRDVCDISQKEILYLDFLMSEDRQVLQKRHNEIAGTLLPYLENGKNIAFLNIGDVSVYSTFSYIADIIRENGGQISVCAGVTSFCAAAAEMREPLVQGKNPLVIMPSSCADFEKLLDTVCTAVIMKSGRDSADIKDKLSQKGFNNINAVCDCGLDTQKIYRGTENIPDKCGYFTLFTAVKEK